MSIWKKNLSPSVWPWLGPILGLVFIYGGVRGIFTQELRYRLWIYHGAAAVIGGIEMLLMSYLMFRGVFWKSRPWQKLDVAAAVSVALVFLGFLISRWADIL